MESAGYVMQGRATRATEAESGDFRGPSDNWDFEGVGRVEEKKRGDRQRSRPGVEEEGRAKFGWNSGVVVEPGGDGRGGGEANQVCAHVKGGQTVGKEKEERG